MRGKRASPNSSVRILGDPTKSEYSREKKERSKARESDLRMKAKRKSNEEMHITKERYEEFEKDIEEDEGISDEIKEKIFRIFKERLGDPREPQYKPEEWLRKKERVMERTGEKTSQSMRDAAKRYYEKNKERVIAEKLRKYHEKKERERPAKEEARRREIEDAERMIRENDEGSTSGVKEEKKRTYNAAAAQVYRENNRDRLREQARKCYHAKKERERPAREQARKNEIEDAERMIREVMGE